MNDLAGLGLRATHNKSANNREHSEHVVVLILTAIPTLTIVVGTIMGNLLVCVAIAHNQQLRKNITNSFCASLAISFGRLVSAGWNLGTTMCNLHVTMDVFLSTASILNLFMVSIDRYYAITRPLLYRSIITKRTAIGMLTFVWILSALIAFIPIYSGWNTADGSVQNLDNPNVCVFVVGNLLYSATIGVGTFYIPLLILYAMYAKILNISYAHVRAIRSQTYHSHEITPQHNVASTTSNNATLSHSHRPRSNSHSHALRQHRATLTLFIIVGAFTACWLPYFSLFTIQPLSLVPSSPLLEEVVLWMGYLNSFVNPFVYGMTNREYRAAFKKLLCSWKRHSKLSLVHHTSCAVPLDTDFICM